MGIHKFGQALTEAFFEAEREHRFLVPESDAMRRALNRNLEVFGMKRPTGLIPIAGGYSDGRGFFDGPADDQAQALISPYPGVFALLRTWNALSPPERMRHVLRALHLAHPTWVFCFTSAAILHGLDISYRLMDAIHIEADSTRCTPAVVRHTCHPPRCSTAYVDGVPVTDLPWTTFSCMRDLSFPFALGIADGFCRHRIAELGDMGIAFDMESQAGRETQLLVQEVERFQGCRGIRRVRGIARLANGASENGGESYARAVMYEQGVRIPKLQVALPDVLDTGRSFRVDYLWDNLPTQDVAGELDGEAKTEDPAMLRGKSTRDALRAERQRESRLTALGYAVARFTFADVRRVRPLVNTLDAFGVPRDVPDGDFLELVGPSRVCKPWVHIR